MSFPIKLKKTNADENEVVTDRAFMRSIITSFFAIVMCIIMLGASTYAWFSTSIESTETITSSVYVLSITVDGEVLEPDEVDGNYVYTFMENTTYTVTATPVAETTAKTGYLKLKIGDKIFVSEQIDSDKSISFTLSYTEQTKVTFIEGWGTSSILPEDRDITNNGEYSNLK